MNNTTKLSPVQKTIVGVQFLFVAFGATVLVPILVGMNPSIALFTAGVGTLLFHLITKGKVPIFLGSSFAFIAPIIKATELYGLPGTLSGLVAVGAVYGIMSALVRFRGVDFITRLFPPVVVGPVIMLIGLSLAGTGVDMAKSNWLLAIIALVTTVKGLDISHVGFAYWNDGTLHLLHASSGTGKVIKDTVTLFNYQKNRNKQIGIRVLRLK